MGEANLAKLQFAKSLQIPTTKRIVSESEYKFKFYDAIFNNCVRQNVMKQNLKQDYMFVVTNHNVIVQGRHLRHLMSILYQSDEENVKTEAQMLTRTVDTQS